jgi:hypothetical protein
MTFELNSLMRRTRYVSAIAVASLVVSVPSHADMSASDLRDYVGYTIVAVLTITGFRDEDGTGKDGAFEGCKNGRTIIFEGNQALKCDGYNYQYAYRPDAVILARNGSWKMIVENETYEMQH